MRIVTRAVATVVGLSLLAGLTGAGDTSSTAGSYEPETAEAQSQEQGRECVQLLSSNVEQRSLPSSDLIHRVVNVPLDQLRPSDALVGITWTWKGEVVSYPSSDFHLVPTSNASPPFPIGALDTDYLRRDGEPAVYLELPGAEVIVEKRCEPVANVVVWAFS